MSLSYGLNFTASDAAAALEKNDRLQNGTRIWRQLFGNAGLGYESQANALTGDFSSVINEAYKNNLLQRENIFRAGLSGGDTMSLLSDSQRNMRDAYATYLSKYGEALSAAGENYGEEVNAITTELTDRGQKFSDLYSSAYKYFTDELVNATRMSSLMGPLPAGQTEQAVRLIDEYGLQDFVDKEGNVLPWENVSTLILNPDGTLTDRGREFLDQAYNLKTTGYTRVDDDGNELAVRSFDKWLSDTNPTLREWAVSQDDYNYTRAGTNLGSAKALAGLESTDTSYAPYTYEDWSELGKYAKDFSSADLGKSVVDAYKSAETGDYKTKAVHSNISGTPQVTSTAEQQRNAAYRRANERLGEYIEQAATQRDELLSYTQRALGTAEYNAFRETNKTLIDEYDAIYKDAVKLAQMYEGEGKNTEYVGDRTSAEIEELVSRYDTWQKKYYNKLKEYADRPKPRASGY